MAEEYLFALSEGFSNSRIIQLRVMMRAPRGSHCDREGVCCKSNPLQAENLAWRIFVLRDTWGIEHSFLEKHSSKR